MADKIDERPYLVSQAINTCLGKNFFELVNGYRVEESKSLMLDENLSHLSMIGIAFEAGFSSKTAFNTLAAILFPTLFSDGHKIIPGQCVGYPV